MRRFAASVLVACIALTALPAVVPVAVAGAATSEYGAVVNDARGDVTTPRGDIVRTSVRYGEDKVTFKTELRDAGSYKTANWQHGDTGVAWFVDTNGDRYEDFFVSIINNGRDRLDGAVFDSYGTLRCRARPSKRGDVFKIRVAHSCVATPRRLRFQGVMAYDRSVSDTSNRSITVDLAPRGLGWSDWARRSPQPTRVVFVRRPARTAPYGTSVSMAVQIRPESYGARRLSLYRRYKGTTRWVKVETKSTDYFGSAVFLFNANRSADFQVRYPGNRDWKPSRTPVARTNVGMIVQLGAVPLEMPVRSRLRVEGRVRPANPGGLVTLQRKTPDGWVNVARASLTAESTYSLVTSPRESRRAVYRVRAAGDGLRVAGHSDRFRIAIYSAKIRAVQPSDPVREVENLNSEYISIVNNGRVPIDVSGWLVGNLNLVVDIPYNNVGVSALQPGDGVRVHTGSGTPSIGHLYLYLDAPFWPPVGVARLYDHDRFMLHELEYGTNDLD